MQKIFANPTRTKYLFILLAAALDTFAIASFMRIGENTAAEVVITYAAFSFVMFLEAAVMLICAYWIRKSLRIYWLAVIVLVLNIISIIFDQIGIADLTFAIFSGALLFSLLIHRKEFIPVADSEAS